MEQMWHPVVVAPPYQFFAVICADGSITKAQRGDNGWRLVGGRLLRGKFKPVLFAFLPNTEHTQSTVSENIEA
jgi:hypothetical protein